MAAALSLARDCAELGSAPFAWLVDARGAARVDEPAPPIDDDLLDAIAAAAPRLGRIILAGGLTSENVADRARRLRPWMVDVASGVESSPGRKDISRVEAFVRAVHSV